MRRTERLFAILQILRARKGAVTAQQLAGELEVSLRTIYRDTAELLAQRVPLRGDAGVGYMLEAGYELPPLMLTADELEAAMLGAAWVAQRGDPSLARGARSLIEKLGQVVPKELRPVLLGGSLRPAYLHGKLDDGVEVALIRTAIREQRKLRLRYASPHAVETERVIWPLFIAFMDEARIVVAHCELRGGFRHFRTDRMLELTALNQKIPDSRRSLMKRWEQEQPWHEGG
jgi:predicted DNA-binding transcriptional regulator YafY